MSFYKSVNINIKCYNTPCCLTVLTHDNKLIKKIILKSFSSRVCFCTKEQIIKIIISCGNKSIYQKIYLKCKKRQDIFVILPISMSSLNVTFLKIMLIDYNYGFPIKEASLNFVKLVL